MSTSISGTEWARAVAEELEEVGVLPSVGGAGAMSLSEAGVDGESEGGGSLMALSWEAAEPSLECLECGDGDGLAAAVEEDEEDGGARVCPLGDGEEAILAEGGVASTRGVSSAPREAPFVSLIFAAPTLVLMRVSHESLAPRAP